MGIKMAFVAFFAASVMVVSGCAGKVQKKNIISRCDHKEPKEFSIKIFTVKKGIKIAPPNALDACFGDEILFKTDDPEVNFKIIFRNNAGPFGKDLESSKGRVKAKVIVKPRADEEGYKYDVEIPGYETLDPWIRIRVK